MFDKSYILILQNFTFLQVQVVIFGHITYIEELLLNLRLNSYKVGTFFICTRGGE